ncbi:hypothetical protein HHK36_015876 [Tetracentron sinense]|uniref:RecQ-mediated genome instability protein 1 n=1 Tax=Tetracentron sinense TaxID=13715 RepID=A0A835DE21_TETSI|nr:hypothetical protein HHK36_015876 [Tetracentron sinense]
MPRRRFRLSCSSDEEEEQEQEQEDEGQRRQSHASAEILSVPDPNPNPIPIPIPAVAPFEDIQFEISDDDFVDVPDNLSPPSPPALIPDQSFQASAVARPDSGSNAGENFDSPISEFLRKLGLRLRREWLDSCISGLESSVAGFASFEVARKAKLCFEQFLFSDMNYSGRGILPENVHAMHLVELAGPFVLQVDEIVNISCPLRDRYQNAPSGIKRCLKLSMTDGDQRLFGMEYRPIKDLEVLAPAGIKVAIRNVSIRHGLLMLVPEVLEVLGGLVEDLDAARQRLVHEVNKPPRGKRTRTGVVPTLATRATLAAWPSNSVNNHGHFDNLTLQGATPFRISDQSLWKQIWALEGCLVPYFLPLHPYISMQKYICRRGIELFIEDILYLVYNKYKRCRTTSVGYGVDSGERNAEALAAPISRATAKPNPSSNAVFDVEEILMVDEVEHPLILTGDKEIPFAYLASLFAKWAAKKDGTQFVQGRIKCFLTGVKGFQYKQRTTFELQVYVDDGSLISEILIDHNVVQKGIGHSPEEVTAALSSSSMKIASDMKETMKKFQIFLLNFEGTLLVEINETSPLPVALEMNQGCPASDAWLLLRRLKSFTSAQTPQHPRSGPIILSP